MSYSHVIPLALIEHHSENNIINSVLTTLPPSTLNHTLLWFRADLELFLPLKQSVRRPAGRGFLPVPDFAPALSPSTYAFCFRARAAEILRLMKRPMRPTATTKTMAKTTTTPASFWAQFSRLAMWEMVSRETRTLLMAGILVVFEGI